MNKNSLVSNLPYSIKYFFILASIVLTFFLLITVQFIVKPLLAAIIIAILLKPISAWLEKKKIPRIFSAFLPILMILIVFVSLIYFFIFQIKDITSDINILSDSINTTADKIQQWAFNHFGITPSKQIDYIKSSSATLLKNSADFLQNIFGDIVNFFTGFFIFFIGLFFFLYYRDFLVSFIFKCFDSSHHHRIKTILKSMQMIARKYIIGLFMVICITATLNSLGLWALNIKHVIFFGVFSGVLTVIPYIGITLGAFFPFLFAFATTDSIWYPLGVLMIFGFVQFLEGNFITPNIMGKQMSLNPFTALLVLILSGMFFGILGIILSLPLLAMVKIVFDSFDSLKPFGYLLGSPK